MDISPQSSAFWWPRLRLSLMPQASPLSRASASMSAQVPSRLPSSM
jgi:hypothetical protein